MLEELLDRLAALTDTAQKRWEAEVRAELEDADWEPDAFVWLTLERYLHDGYWFHCGFRVQEDEATTWAIRGDGATRLEAAQALLDQLTA